MNTDMKSRMNAAKHLSDEIGQIGALDRRRIGRGSGMSVDGQAETQIDGRLPQGGAMPVSPPTNQASKLLKVIVADAAAKEDLCKLPERAYHDFADVSQPTDCMKPSPVCWTCVLGSSTICLTKLLLNRRTSRMLMSSCLRCKLSGVPCRPW